MSSIRRVIAISFADKYTTTLIYFISTVIIARLLTPEEIGIYSVGAAVISIMHSLRDFGITNYLVQEKELTEKRIQTAFTITLIIGFTLGLIIFLLAKSVANFYSEEGLYLVMTVIAFNFFLIPFGGIPLTLLRRNLNFKPLYWINLCSALVHMLTSIILAANGFGFMSLAWAALAGVVTTVIGSLIAAPQYFVTRTSFSEYNRVLKTGGQFSVISIFNSIGTSAPDMIIGRMLGFSELAFFNRALSFVQLVDRTLLKGLQPVLLPYFAKQNREKQNINTTYLLGIEIITGLTWPFLFLLAMMAAPLIHLLFGNQWGESVPLVQIICFAMAFRFINPLTQNALFGGGHTYTVMIFTIALQCFKIIFIFIGCIYGLIGVAIAYTAGEILGMVVLAFIAKRKFHLAFKHLSFPVLRSGLLTLWCTIPSISIIRIFGLDETINTTSLIIMIFISIFSFIFWLVGIYLFKHSIRYEINRVLKL